MGLDIIKHLKIPIMGVSEKKRKERQRKPNLI